MDEQKKNPDNPQHSPTEIQQLRQAVLQWLDKKNESKLKPTPARTRPKPTPIESTPKPTPEPPKPAIEVAETPIKSVEQRLPASVTASQRPRNIGKLILKMLFGIVSVAILSIATFGWLLYQFKWQQPWVSTVTAIIPYPVVIVNYHPLAYHEWQSEVSTLYRFYLKGKDANPELAIPTLAETQDHILNRMIDRELINQLANRYNLTVTDQELDRNTQALMAEIGGEQALKDQLDKLYGWSIADFQKTILQSVLLKNKLKLALTLDERVNPEVRTRAEQVLEEVRTSGKDFADLAGQYSEDVTATKGGDLGYFSRGQMGPEFEAAAFSLEPGQTSGLVQTEFGYHIIKLEEKLKDDSGEVTQIRARQILLRTQSLDEYLATVKQEAKIWRLVN